MGEIVIKIEGHQYDPPSQALKGGDTVMWKNLTGQVQTATSDTPPDNPLFFDTGDIAAGQSSQLWRVPDVAWPKIDYHSKYDAQLRGALSFSLKNDNATEEEKRHTGHTGI
jgi:hypothetical protein